jgi:hypothetical protein
MTRERFLRIGNILGEAILTVAALLWLIWYFAPRELIEKRFSLDLTPAPGREIFRILTGGERFPKFTLAVIEPQDVKPGDVQKLTVQVEDPDGVASVAAETELDNSDVTLSLELRQGDGQSGYWTNAWIVRDTHSKTYRTTFTAKNSKGQTSSITLAWSDSCTPPLGGDWIVGASCTISSVTGADNGNIVFSTGGSITVPSGATLVYNSGRSISIGPGSIAISDGGQIKEANIFVTDADGDGYAPSNFTRTWSTASSLAGYVRQYTLATDPFDCYDANANARPGQTSWFTTNRGDGSFDYNCNGGIEYQYDTTSDLCGCGDTIARPGFETNPACGNSDAYYTGSCTYIGGCGRKSEGGYYRSDSETRTQGCH